MTRSRLVIDKAIDRVRKLVSIDSTEKPMSKKKPPAQLQREINEALATPFVLHGDRWISRKEAEARAAFEPKLYEKAVAEGRVSPAVATRIAKASRRPSGNGGSSHATKRTKNPFRQKELHWDPAVRGRGQVAARSGHRAFVYPDDFGRWSWEVTSPVEETRGGITRTVHFRKQVGTANSKAQAKVAAERFLLAQLS